MTIVENNIKTPTNCLLRWIMDVEENCLTALATNQFRELFFSLETSFEMKQSSISGWSHFSLSVRKKKDNDAGFPRVTKVLHRSFVRWFLWEKIRYKLKFFCLCMRNEEIIINNFHLLFLMNKYKVSCGSPRPPLKPICH